MYSNSNQFFRFSHFGSVIATSSSITLLWHSSPHSLFIMNSSLKSVMILIPSFTYSLDLYIITISTSGIYLIPSWWIVTTIIHFSCSIILKQSTFTNMTANWVITKPTTHKLHNYTTLLLETNASSPNGSFNGSRLKRWRYTSMVTLGLKRIDPLKALIANTNSTPWYLYETLHESVLSSVTEPTNWKLHR